MAVEFTRRRFTVDEYSQMPEAGILHEDERVELIDGEIVQIAPSGPGHSGHVARFTKVLERGFGDLVLVFVQSSVRLDEYHEPQPDLMLLRPRADWPMGWPRPEQGRACWRPGCCSRG